MSMCVLESSQYCVWCVSFQVPSIRRIALFAAAEHGNIDTLETLLSQSVNPNMWSEVSITLFVSFPWRRSKEVQVL